METDLLKETTKEKPKKKNLPSLQCKYFSQSRWKCHLLKRQTIVIYSNQNKAKKKKRERKKRILLQSESHFDQSMNVRTMEKNNYAKCILLITKMQLFGLLDKQKEPSNISLIVVTIIVILSKISIIINIAPHFY